MTSGFMAIYRRMEVPFTEARNTEGKAGEEGR